MKLYFIVGFITAFIIFFVKFYMHGTRAFRVTDSPRKDVLASTIVFAVVVCSWPAWWCVYLWGFYLDARKKWFGDFQ